MTPFFLPPHERADHLFLFSRGASQARVSSTNPRQRERRMARDKVKLRRIDDRGRRLVSFSKRRSGLLKKARELAVLCDAEVGVIVFSPKGKLSHYSSHSCSMEKTIQRYTRFLDAERSVNNHTLQAEGRCVGLDNEVTEEVAQKMFDDRSIEQLNINELTKLEEKLETSLSQVRSRKTKLLMDFVSKLREQERTLACQNQRLQSAVAGDYDDGGEVGEPRRGDRDRPSNSSSSSRSSSSSAGSNTAAPPAPSSSSTSQPLGGA